jgi:hypothetical protein
VGDPDSEYEVRHVIGHGLGEIVVLRARRWVLVLQVAKDGMEVSAHMSDFQVDMIAMMRLTIRLHVVLSTRMSELRVSSQSAIIREDHFLGCTSKPRKHVISTGALHSLASQPQPSIITS